MMKASWKKLLFFLSIIGPGIITANIDNDAGGIATYSLVGAESGYRLLWVLFPITLSLILVQEMSARMAIVTGKGLADLIREKFGLKVTFYTLFFLIFADLANIMAEFAGIASAAQIFGVSKYISLPLSALFVWLLILKGNYKVVEKIFIVGCLVYFSYIISGFVIGPDWSEVIRNVLIPRPQNLRPQDFTLIVGLVGTTITPWMQFYIQSAMVEKGIKLENLNYSRIDVMVGCFFMFLVALFIIICCAATIHGQGLTITDAADAALSLAPIAGENATILFGLGLLNASLFAAALLPLASSYYVCEGLGWDSGVDKTFKEAPNFFIIFTGLILASVLLVLVPEINLFKILIWSQVVNGVLIPIVLIYIVNLCNDPDIMGEHINPPWMNMASYAVVALMILANSALIYFEIFS